MFAKMGEAKHTASKVKLSATLNLHDHNRKIYVDFCFIW